MENLESLEKLENVVARIKRLETSLESNIKTFAKYQGKLAEDSQALTLEVEQIKELKDSMIQTLSDTVEDAVNSMAPELVSLVVKGIEEESMQIVEENLSQLQKMRSLTEDVLSQANRVMSSYKRDITLRRMWLGGMFWLGSMVTAGLIYYYFPQNIHQGFSDGFIKTYFLGKVVLDNYNDLNPKDKALIQEKFNKIYYGGKK